MGKSSKKPSNFTKKTSVDQLRCQVVKALYEKSVLLTDWWLIEVESDYKGKRIGVAGRSSRERLAVRNYKSTAILKRHDATTLETEDGISITITNGINMFRTLQNGFPGEVCNHFLSGFPYDWKEFSDKCVGEKSTSSSTSDVNGVASSIDDLPVAHVRDILMLSNGDSARSLIEKCISRHIPRKQEDSAEKDYVDCAKKEAKRKRQEDDVNDIRFEAGDLSDGTIPRNKSASIDPKSATSHKSDDTNENSRLASGYFSDDATLKTQDVSKIEENSNDVNGVLCLMDTIKATDWTEDDKSQLVSDYPSDDATLKTQNARKFEEKRKDKGHTLCPKNTIKTTTRKEDDTNKNNRLVTGHLSDDATPKTKGASIVPKNAANHKDGDTNEHYRSTSGDLSDNATLKIQHVSTVEENSNVSVVIGILCLADKKKATDWTEDDSNGKSQFVSDDLSDDKGHALCSRNSKKTTTCKEDETNKKSRLGSGDLSDDATPRTSKTNNIEGKSSNDKGDALCSTDPIKEKTPKATVTRSKNKSSSRRITRSMSRSSTLRKRR